MLRLLRGRDPPAEHAVLTVRENETSIAKSIFRNLITTGRGFTQLATLDYEIEECGAVVRECVV